MISACVFTCGGAGIPPVQTDLEAVGVGVSASAEIRTMVQDVIRRAPDVVVCYENDPGDALFAGIASLRDVAPRPVVVFTSDTDADKIGRAAASGIHAYVINGYGPHRLRSVIHVAQARFRHEQTLRDELSDVHHRFNERKLVDRAKGILMRLRDISEEEAYGVLRRAAMRGKQRIGQAARQVIDASRYAEAVNRAGQLRMLSQRIVKLYALMCAEVTPDVTAALCRESIEQIESNLASLARSLSKATFGDLIEGVAVPWGPLKAFLKANPSIDTIPEIDRLAERLLLQAEALTKTLEAAGLAAALHVINVSGRQRMLSQRMAKQAILATLRGGAASDMEDLRQSRAAFVDGLVYLRSVPLTTSDIRALLDGADSAWAAFEAAIARSDAGLARREIAVVSETLLAQFVDLTNRYESGMQVLMA